MTFPLPLTRPLIFFDLETTGLDFKYDRAIELGALKIHPDGREEKFLKRFNPGMRIPAEITALTHISNEDVANAPKFSEAAPEVELFFRGCDLGGYNINRFDVKVMIEEFKRVGLDFKTEERLVIDAQVIFHQKEKRDLASAYKFYCEKNLTDAHTAQADTDATYEIFLAQLKRYSDLPQNMEGLHIFCRGDQERFVDSEGKFFWRDGEAVFNFGRYKSHSLREIAKNDPSYLQWVMSPDRHFGQDVVDLCYRAMKGEFPSKKAAV
jgi:DNA polymerase-3 subunit epsilon